ncbi:hypothetical protein LINPERPRIM_LOCUS9472 [Linum perenne]
MMEFQHKGVPILEVQGFCCLEWEVSERFTIFKDFDFYTTRFGDSFAPSYKMSRYGWAEPLVDRTPEVVRPQPSDCSLLWGGDQA